MINVLLLNWNSSQDIDLSIENILDSDYENFRIILIDNFSKEEDINNLKIIYEKFHNLCEIHLLLNGENYGYAGGNNRGYEYLLDNNLDGDILVLNPDVTISTNTLFELKNSLYENIAGGVMCKTLKPEGTLMYDYIKLNGYFQKWLSASPETIETDYLAGSCMLLKREAIDNIGLFDESFFMYWEEVDLSFRIKKIGLKLISTTTTEIVRKENPPERNVNAIYYATKNSIKLYKKHDCFKLYSLFFYLSYSFLSVVKQIIIFKDLSYIIKFTKGLMS